MSLLSRRLHLPVVEVQCKDTTASFGKTPQPSTVVSEIHRVLIFLSIDRCGFILVSGQLRAYLLFFLRDLTWRLSNCVGSKGAEESAPSR